MLWAMKNRIPSLAILADFQDQRMWDENIGAHEELETSVSFEQFCSMQWEKQARALREGVIDGIKRSRHKGYSVDQIPEIAVLVGSDSTKFSAYQRVLSPEDFKD